MNDTKWTIHVYRDMSNRTAGEPDSGPMAWDAHRRRMRVLDEALDDPAIRVIMNDEARDDQMTHEVAEAVVEIGKNPGAAMVLGSAASYIGTTLARKIDEAVGDGVGRLFQRLLNAYRRMEIGGFWIETANGVRLVLRSDSRVVITIDEGNLVSFKPGTPQSNEGIRAHSDAL
jgi:hypothetical protein